MRITEQVARLLEPVLRRISALVARGVVTRVIDARKLQELQLSVLAGEKVDGVERFQAYGLTSVPDLGAEALLLCVNGSRDHALAIAVDDRRYRPTTLAPGEVCLYSKHGQRVHLQSNGGLEIVAGAATIKVDASGVITFDASDAVDFKVGGTILSVASSGVTITTPGGVAEFM